VDLTFFYAFLVSTLGIGPHGATFCPGLDPVCVSQRDTMLIVLVPAFVGLFGIGSALIGGDWRVNVLGAMGALGSTTMVMGAMAYAYGLSRITSLCEWGTGLAFVTGGLLLFSLCLPPHERVIFGPYDGDDARGA
jgi:hypothetical protein